MATQVQNRRGTTAEHSAFTGAVGEVTIDTDKDTVVVHDGATAGGRPLLREDGSNSALALGSAATPSLKFTGDTNTGIYSPGADQLALSTNGTGRLFVDSAGRVGIGTTPSERLHVSGGNARFEGNYVSFNNNGYIRTDATNELRLQMGSSGTTFYNSGNSAEYARIDSSGRLLVGTSSARTNFNANADGPTLAQIEGTTFGSASLSITRNSNDPGSPALEIAKTRGTAVGQNTLVANGDPFGFINFAGTDGTNPVRGASISAWCDGTPGANDMPGRLVFSTNPGSPTTSPVERMRIKANGTISYNSATIAHGALFAATNGSNVGWAFGPNSTSAYVVYNSAGSGVYLTSGNTSWTGSSDERLKTDLTPIENGLGKVGTLRAVTGRFKTDENSVSRSFLIAQDVQAVLPEAVDATDENALGLRYTEVIPLLVAALKESKERIETLEAKVAALESAYS